MDPQREFRIAATLCWLALVLSLTSCRAHNPLAPAASAIVDDRLVGIWEQINENGTPAFEAPMLVMRLGDNEYLSGPLADGDESLDPEETARMYLTEAGAYRFLNVRYLEELEYFYFVRIDAQTDDTIHLHMLPERVFADADMSSDELTAFLVEHAEDARVFPRDGLLRFRRISVDRTVPRREAEAFEAEFGILNAFGIEERTTTIPRSRCEDFRFGFDLTPPDSLSYDYYVVHEFPTMPTNVTGERLADGPPARLRGLSRTARGPKILAFGFDESDPLGAYRSELYVNDELRMAVDYTVVEPAGSSSSTQNECDDP